MYAGEEYVCDEKRVSGWMTVVKIADLEPDTEFMPVFFIGNMGSMYKHFMQVFA